MKKFIGGIGEITLYVMLFGLVFLALSIYYDLLTAF